MSALDAVISQHSWIDPVKLGISGASYGGFMTNWAISHSNRFSAAVSVAAMSNLVSDEGTRDDAYGHVHAFGGDIFHDFDLYWKYSPLRYAQSVKTPTLILHGEADYRVPIEQPEQWFHALRHFNVPAELVVFPREHHSSFATGEPNHVVEAMRWMVYWFDRYIKLEKGAVAPDTIELDPVPRH
jgi:dipeptidyl aminopeptidase/acylaminoacyl peptidase